MYKEYFIYDATKTLTGGAGTAYETHNIRIDSDSDFEFIKTTFVATNDRIRLRYRDDSAGRYLTKGNPDIKAIAGGNFLQMGLSNSFLPFIWPEPYKIAAATNLLVEATDYSGANNTMRLAFHGNKQRQGVSPWKEKKWRKVMPFVYTLENAPISLAANASGSYTVQIDIDAHFLVQKIVGIRTAGALISISEASRGRDWMNTSVHIDNLVGNSVFPNILPAPRFVPRGGVIIVNMTDISGAANTIDIDFIGVKLYE